MEAVIDRTPVIVAWNKSNIKCYYYSFEGLIKFIKACNQCFYDWNITLFDYDKSVLYNGNFGIYCEYHTWLFKL